MKIYGPYTRKDGRKHVIVHYDGGRIRTVSYPKWLMEQHLGRELEAVVLVSTDVIYKTDVDNQLH
jgi:hypothetical protein